MGGAQNVLRRKELLECRVAGGARHAFVDMPGVVRREIRIQHREVDRQPETDLHALARPPRRFRMQVVIDVDGAQSQTGFTLARPNERMEQRERVRSTAEGDDEAGLRGKRGRESGDGVGSEQAVVESVHVKTAGPAQYAFRRSPVRRSTREAISSTDAALVSRHGIR